MPIRVVPGGRIRYFRRMEPVDHPIESGETCDAKQGNPRFVVTPVDPDLLPDGTSKPWPMRRRIVGWLIGWLFGRRRPRGKVPIDELQRVLLIRTDRLGDGVISTPVIAALDQLTQAYGGQINIDLLGSRHNAPLFAADRRVDTTFRWDLPIRDRLANLRACRSRRHDLVLQLNLSRTTNLTILARLLAPNGHIVGRGHTYNSRLFDVVAPQSPHPHFIDQTYDILLHAIDWKEPPPPRPAPAIALPERMIEETDVLLKAAGLTVADRPLLLVNLSAGAIDRSFGIERATTMVDQLAQLAVEKGWEIALSGGPDEQEKCAAISERTGLPLLRFPSILHLGCAIERASLLVTPDTGPVHLASAVGTETIAYYAEFDKPAGWGPLHGTTVVTETDGDVNGVDIEEIIKAAARSVEKQARSGG